MLAEICESLDKERYQYQLDITKALSDKDARSKELDVALSELKQMKEIFQSVDKLYERLKQLPAEDFLNLYHKMKGLMDCGTEIKENGLWTTISNRLETGTLTTIK